MGKRKSIAGINQSLIALALLSLISLFATIWVLVNVRHELEIVSRLIGHLQGSDLEFANELSSELGVQRSLSLLLILNTIATSIAFWIVARAYLSSERNLEEAKVLSADILESMDIGVITTDNHGNISSINTVGRQLMTMSNADANASIAAGEPGGQLLAEVYHDAFRWISHPRDQEYRIDCNGQRRILRASGTMLKNRDQEQIGMVIQIRDVTDRVLIEERLRRMERHMGLGSLAAGLQHEIKNPLNALSLHIQLLGERLQKEPEDPEINEMLDILYTEVKRIAAVLDGFQNYASIHEIGKTSVDVASLIDKLIRLLRPEAEQKKISLEFSAPPEQPLLIQADPAQLEQVLLNLALNAMSAMPNGGTVRFAVSVAPHSLRLDISDTGYGIPPEIQSRIFDPYFTTRSDGTGMGLALCEKIVRQHDGRIDFQSSDSGTIFSIHLPRNSPPHA
jgi:two-component system sensor histidine kinase HydH